MLTQRLERVSADHVDAFLHPQFDPKEKAAARKRGELLATGLNVSPGAASGVLAFDALIPLAGFWHGSAATRFVSGLAFGIVASQLVTRGLEEFAQEFSWRRLAPRSAQLKGDVV